MEPRKLRQLSLTSRFRREEGPAPRFHGTARVSGLKATTVRGWAASDLGVVGYGE